MTDNITNFKPYKYPRIDLNHQTAVWISAGHNKTVWKVFDASTHVFKAIAQFHLLIDEVDESTFNEKQRKAYREYQTQQVIAAILHEKSILDRLYGCPHIIRLEAIMFDGILPVFVMPFYEVGDLSNAIRENRLSTSDKIKIAVDLLQAISECHGRMVCVQDLKPANVLLTNDTHAVLCDFGCSISTTDPTFLKQDTYYLFQNIFAQLFTESDGPSHSLIQSFLQKHDWAHSISISEALELFRSSLRL